MNNKIQKMYIQDCSIIIIFTIILTVLLIYVMSVISDIATKNIERISIYATGITVCCFVSSSSFAVISHLKKNKNQLYKEDIFYTNMTNDK